MTLWNQASHVVNGQGEHLWALPEVLASDANCSTWAWEKKALHSHFWEPKLLKGAYYVLLGAEEILAQLRIEVLKKLIDQLPFEERFRWTTLVCQVCVQVLICLD